MISDGLLGRLKAMCDVRTSFDRLQEAIFMLEWNWRQNGAPYSGELNQWGSHISVSSECL